jgi:hypothetical protein
MMSFPEKHHRPHARPNYRTTFICLSPGTTLLWAPDISAPSPAQNTRHRIKLTNQYGEQRTLGSFTAGLKAAGQIRKTRF